MNFLKITEASKGRKTLIFDLDETLIHCNENQNNPSDVRVPVTFPNGVQIMAGNFYFIVFKFDDNSKSKLFILFNSNQSIMSFFIIFF